MNNIKAQYPGKCRGCNTWFDIGTPIERRGHYWYIVGCPQCKKREEGIVVLWDLHRRMMDKHHISYGLHGLTDHLPSNSTFADDIDALNNPNPDIITTGSPEEFLNLCIQYGEATDDEIEKFKQCHVGSMRRDLYA